MANTSLTNGAFRRTSGGFTPPFGPSGDRYTRRYNIKLAPYPLSPMIASRTGTLYNSFGGDPCQSKRPIRGCAKGSPRY